MRNRPMLCTLAVPAVLAWPASAAWAQLYAITATGSLWRVDPTNANATFVGTGVYAGEGPGSLEWNPTDGTLWANTIGVGPSLYTVNPGTGAANRVGGNAIFLMVEGGLQLAPNGVLYAASGDNTEQAKLLSIDTTTGAASVIGTMPPPGDRVDVNGLGWRSDGVLLGLDSIGNRFITINPATAEIATLAPLPGGVFAGIVGGMATNADTGYFVTASNNLYSFIASTGGAVTFIGLLPFQPRGLAIVPTPDCPADFNHDGQVDFFDYLDFAQAFSTDDPAADFNGDSQVDFFDYLDFAQAFDAGC